MSHYASKRFFVTFKVVFLYGTLRYPLGRRCRVGSVVYLTFSCFRNPSADPPSLLFYLSESDAVDSACAEAPDMCDTYPRAEHSPSTSPSRLRLIRHVLM